jgi:hypothetical protein
MINAELKLPNFAVSIQNLATRQLEKALFFDILEMKL